MGEGEALDLIRDRLRTHTSWRAFVATGHQDADIPTDGTSRGGSTVDGAWPPARLARLRLRVRAILHDPSLQTPGFEPRGEDVYHTAEDDEEDWERARASGALDALLGRATTATAARDGRTERTYASAARSPRRASRRTTGARITATRSQSRRLCARSQQGEPGEREGSRVQSGVAGRDGGRGQRRGRIRRGRDVTART